MAYYVGVDLGATNVRAVVGEGPDVVARASRPTPRGPSGIAVTEAVLDVVREACADAGVDPHDVVAAGVASIGPLDLSVGGVDSPSNLPDTIDYIPLTGPLSNLLGTDDVYLHNDAGAGVIGERFHSERNPDDMVYLTISSGIGAGVCVDGNVLAGWDGNAGEVGHITVDPDGERRCGCGRLGHWEAYCSGNNVPGYAEHLHDPGVETTLPLGGPDFSAKDVFEAAARGDDFAAEVVERVTAWNAIGVATIVQAYAPLAIYVGGAVATNNPEQIVDPLRERVPDLVFGNVPELRLTTLGEDVVVRGALVSAMTSGTGDRAKL
jgi:glucokinase